MYRTLLLLGALVAVSLGCNCDVMPQKAKDKFCRSDFVGVLNIVSRKNATKKFPFLTYVGHPLDKETIFKSPFTTEGKNFTIKIKTDQDLDTNAWACGVTWLENGKNYLLNGNIYHDKLHINSCSEIDAEAEWEAVPDDIKKALSDREYEKACFADE
uniref:NTR domain-containing protein n=1 Tax=Steinernema glaseri TaxID=37863 RepID=A0A1I7Z0S9_9BILA